MSDTASLPRPAESLRRALSIVDCDFHPFVPLEEVFDRLSPRSRRSVAVTDYGAVLGREYNRFLHPTGAPLRLDAVPPKGGLAGSDPDYAVEDYLERWGISAAIMMPLQNQAVIAWADEQAVAEFLSALNDLCLAYWHGRDERFKLLISVSPHDPETAIAEVERLADAPGVVGIAVPMAELGFGSPSMMRLYEVAARNRLPVVLHPNGADGSLVNSPSGAGRVTRSYAERHAMLAQVGQGIATSVVMSGALARFPDLRIALTEFGFSWAGPVMWRMDAAWRRDGGPNEKLPLPPSTYMINQIRYSTQPFDEPDRKEQLAPFLEAIQAERTLMFSSDYPHWDTDHPDVILKNRVPATLRARVAAGNAIDTFGDRLWR